MRRTKLYAIFLSIIITIFAGFPSFAFASDNTTKAQSTGILSRLVTPMGANPGVVANIRIFASSDSTSSIPSASGHAWIVLTNYQSSTATFGQLSNIGQYKSVSIGTWGNQSEHLGVFYDLESYLVYYKSAWPNRVSLSMDLDLGQLQTVNSVIINNDSWSNFNNCSDFASKVWNSVSSNKVSNGTFHTPTALRDSIKSYSWYSTGSPFSYDYNVYYAQGYSAPQPSTIYVN